VALEAMARGSPVIAGRIVAVYSALVPDSGPPNLKVSATVLTSNVFWDKLGYKAFLGRVSSTSDPLLGLYGRLQRTSQDLLSLALPEPTVLALEKHSNGLRHKRTR
jgi:hypothetical protein